MSVLDPQYESTLGRATGITSFKVAIAGTATQISASATDYGRGVSYYAPLTNVEPVYLGGANVTDLSGAHPGRILYPGGYIVSDPVADVSMRWAITTSGGACVLAVEGLS